MADMAREARRELGASEKPDMQWRLVGGLLGLVVGFASRKVLAFAWEKATGRKPPASADSPDIGLGEAIAYAVVMGLGMEVTRIVATRAAAKKWRSWKDAARDLTP
ncbi:DUF4235 domain-containing protein [Microbispora sp. ATCC PTA-5024]|uniref:DUF4235 domain-containing protein n=1 Tax=Microbispora sp. ATCC PTA-5024 TaxID=316330 RepID=UPI0003DB9954|nr:DUF4235 domain-containing protein [Microbispora sp. ATCC PTA-5024]ETK32392.1 hypothetical protein MPTA5024_29950 [Microbispora sp. ATCC PTA-5024]